MDRLGRVFISGTRPVRGISLDDLLICLCWLAKKSATWIGPVLLVPYKNGVISDAFIDALVDAVFGGLESPGANARVHS